MASCPHLQRLPQCPTVPEPRPVPGGKVSVESKTRSGPSPDSQPAATTFSPVPASVDPSEEWQRAGSHVRSAYTARHPRGLVLQTEPAKLKTQPTTAPTLQDCPRRLPLVHSLAPRGVDTGPCQLPQLPGARRLLWGEAGRSAPSSYSRAWEGLGGLPSPGCWQVWRAESWSAREDSVRGSSTPSTQQGAEGQAKRPQGGGMFQM